MEPLRCDVCGTDKPITKPAEEGFCCATPMCHGSMQRVFVPQSDGDAGPFRVVNNHLEGMYLPADSASRKEMPVCTGFLDYFPLAAAAVARLSKKGNDKHNPGQPLHWSRGKSMDHADCAARHLIDRGLIDPEDGESHTTKLAWRAMALLEEEEEKRLGVRMSRASRVAT